MVLDFRGEIGLGIDLTPWRNEKPLEVRGAKETEESKERASRRNIRKRGVQETSEEGISQRRQ